MFKRLLRSLLIIAIITDIWWQAFIKTPIYVVTGRAMPAVRETISATAGQMASDGSQFGKWLAEQIDDIFGAGHCARAFAAESAAGDVVKV